MFFGGVEGVVRREWRRQFVTVDLRSVPVDVDVEPLLGHVMGGFILSDVISWSYASRSAVQPCEYSQESVTM